MPLLKRNHYAIPPVPESSRSASGGPPPEDSHDTMRRNAAIGDVYSRGGGQVNNDRSELFAGYEPSKSGSGRFFDGPQLGRDPPPPGEENEEDVEGIRTQTRFIKQESVQSSRNALRMAREAEETARGTLLKLGNQSEKLADTERHLSVAKGHSARAEDQTNELKQLNRSIFRPVITFNKDAKRAAQEAKVQARFEQEREERERGMMDIRETQNRLGRAGRDDDDEGDEGIRLGKTTDKLAARKMERKRFQFEETASDDELEDELDDNLDGISQATKTLKSLGLAMGQELDEQNTRIRRIDDQASALDSHIFKNTERLKKIK